MHTDYTPTIYFSNFHNVVDERRIEDQASKQHNALSLNSAEISVIEHEIIFKKNKNEDLFYDSENLKLKLTNNKNNFLVFIKTEEFREILYDVIKDISKLTELALPYVTDKTKFTADMATLTTKLKNITIYEQYEIYDLINFFSTTRKGIKTSIQFFNSITAYNIYINETQQLFIENDLKDIQSASIEDDVILSFPKLRRVLNELYFTLENILEKNYLIKETITNMLSSIARKNRKNETTAGNKSFDKGVADRDENNALIKIVVDNLGIDAPYDPFARKITDDLTIKQFKNKVEIAASPYNILLTLTDEMFDKLTKILENHACKELFTKGFSEKEIPQDLISDINNLFIKPLNSVLLFNNSVTLNETINIDDILKLNNSGAMISIKDLTAKLRFLIVQKLLGKKLQWIVSEISTQYNSLNFEQVIVAIGNSYFCVMDKKNLYTDNNEINITFDNNIAVQLQHINPELITKNNLQKTSYRPLIIEALKNTENAIEIINFFNSNEIKNILLEDLEFSAYLAEIISNKAKKSHALKENLAELVCNEIVATNKNILADNSSYNIFMNSTFIEPILYKLLEQKIDITDILARLAISQIVNLSQKDSLKNLCDQALALIDNADAAKQKLVANFTKIHQKLMKYGHSHVIPLIIRTNLINSALGMITQDDNENELLICARHSDLDSVKIILQENSKRSMQNKLDINHRNNKGHTALNISVMHEDIDMLTEIIKDSNVNVNLKNKNGWTALMSAVHSNNLEIVKILLEKNADVNLKKTSNMADESWSEWTALMFAVYNNNLEIVKILLENKANTNLRGYCDYGDVALQIAVYEGYTSCLKMLLNYKADINIRDRCGSTALILAAEVGDVQIVKMLLDHQADINLQTMGGQTALMGAIRCDDIECLKTLLNHQADINIQDKKGNTALMIAIEYDDAEYVEMLLNHQADINIQNKKGNTALMVAIEYDNAECVEMLLNHQADVKLTNKNGETALDIAKAKENKKCIAYLENHSCKRTYKECEQDLTKTEIKKIKL